jgi:hypothetical protein
MWCRGRNRTADAGSFQGNNMLDTVERYGNTFPPLASNVPLKIDWLFVVIR